MRGIAFDLSFSGLRTCKTHISIHSYLCPQYPPPARLSRPFLTSPDRNTIRYSLHRRLDPIRTHNHTIDPHDLHNKQPIPHTKLTNPTINITLCVTSKSLGRQRTAPCHCTRRIGSFRDQSLL